MNYRLTLTALTSLLLLVPFHASANPILIVGQASRPKDFEGAIAVKSFVYSQKTYSTGKTIKPFPVNYPGGIRVSVGDRWRRNHLSFLS